MTTPIAPKLLKGAIIGIDILNPIPNVIVFQCNPAELTRRLTARTTGREAGAENPGEAMRLTGPPEETIDATIEIDAADQLETGDGVASAMGVHPALSALETLLYPDSGLVIANEVLARAGIIEVVPAQAPMVLFVWGPSRILPVRITSFTINEKQFDARLNPIRAEVSLGMKVLSYHDLGLAHPGGVMFMAHQISKEIIAKLELRGSVSRPGVTLPI